MSRHVVLSLALVAALPTVVFAQPKPSNFSVNDIVSVTHDDDPADPKKPVTEVVIISEGYPEGQKARFLEKARQIKASLRTDEASSVMREVTTFHFTTVWVPSTGDGAPWFNGDPARDTPFRAHVEKDGSLAADHAAIDRAVKKVASGQNTTVPVVLINFLSKKEGAPKKKPPKTGRNADDLNTSPGDVRDISDTPEDLYKDLATNSDRRERAGGHAAEVGRVLQVDLDMRAFVHEFGHARFGLDDEYANDPDQALPANERNGVAQFPNNTIDPSGARWRNVVPELFDESGKLKQPLIEGGSGYGKKVWHAYKLCRMNQSRSEDFCPVCKAAIRGSVMDGKPLAAPVWLAPVSQDGSTKLTVEKDGSKTVALRWKPGSSEQPNSWHLELTDATGKVVLKKDVEGHQRSLDIDAPGPGRYTLSLQAVRIARADPRNHSPVAEVPLFIPKKPELVTRDDRDKADAKLLPDRGFSRTTGLDGKLVEATKGATDPAKDVDER